MWTDILYINVNKIYIEYVNSFLLILLFIRKINLDTNCPYNGLEEDIYSLRNEFIVLFLGEFNDINN
jgi:hypothetical protein